MRTRIYAHAFVKLLRTCAHYEHLVTCVRTECALNTNVHAVCALYTHVRAACTRMYEQSIHACTIVRAACTRMYV